MLTYTKCYQKLKAIDQIDLLRQFSTLTCEQQQDLLDQIEQIDIEKLFKQKEQLSKSKLTNTLPIEPIISVANAKEENYTLLGQSLVASGQTACLVVAGGQGTRLEAVGPKGAFPISVVRQKSLFQLIFEKVKAAGKQVGKKLAIAIMTSPHNHIQTIEFLKSHHYFGLDEDQVDLFSQRELPFLDEAGRMFLAAPDIIAQGPNGNGQALELLWHSGIGAKWQAQGVRFVNFILVDNPLADPFDYQLFGFQKSLNLQIAVKTIKRRGPQENVGLLVLKNGRISVIEYTEIGESERQTILPSGELKFSFANLSLFAFELKFIEQLANDSTPTLLHKAYKTCPKWDEESGQHLIRAWKFETFIFDVFESAERIGILEFDRQECFAPLKNKEGPDSIETVQEALKQRDRQMASLVTQRPAPTYLFELAPDFYYPTDGLLAKWHNRDIPEGYVEA